jgi:SpoIID/LytB domain protein
MRRRVAFLSITAALTAGLVASPAGPQAAAASSRTFKFYGSGWGHGIGLSQYGAYGLAQRGWSHRRILTHYYDHTSIGPAPDAPRAVRVGVAEGDGALHIGAAGGPVELRVGGPVHGKLAGTVKTGYTWTIDGSKGRYRILNAKGRPVATVGGMKVNLYARLPRGSRAFLPEAGYSYDRGYVEMNIYRDCQSCSFRMRAIVVVSPQDYLAGVAEVSSSWPVEAMKAQADAARSYAFYVIGWRGQHRETCNCGVYSSTIDQAYHGYAKETEGTGWLDAVAATRNEVVLYDGRTILANYYASSGGYTESNENVWFDDPVPYLRAVCDPGDYTSINPVRTWTEAMSAEDAGAALARYGYSVGTVTSFGKVKRSASGRIVSLVVNGTGGSDGKSVRVSGPSFSGALGLMDDKVWIDVDRNIVGDIRSEYDSQMCRPGLAKTAPHRVAGGKVQRFAEGAIYKNDGRRKASWVHGAIYHEFLAVHGMKLLGLPRGEEADLTAPGVCAPDSFKCRRQRFQRGRIYYEQGVGAHEVHGDVLAYYLSRGGSGGKLGFPTSDVQPQEGGGSVARFEHGTVRCRASGKCSTS